VPGSPSSWPVTPARCSTRTATASRSPRPPTVRRRDRAQGRSKDDDRVPDRRLPAPSRSSRASERVLQPGYDYGAEYEYASTSPRRSRPKTDQRVAKVEPSPVTDEQARRLRRPTRLVSVPPTCSAVLAARRTAPAPAEFATAFSGPMPRKPRERAKRRKRRSRGGFGTRTGPSELGPLAPLPPPAPAFHPEQPRRCAPRDQPSIPNSIGTYPSLAWAVARTNSMKAVRFAP
jgi:hypothetical protein